MNVVRWLYDGPRERTWVAHFLVGALMALLFDWWFPIAFYALREAEGIAYSGAQEWTDHIMDVVAPTVAAILIWRLHAG